MKATRLVFSTLLLCAFLMTGAAFAQDDGLPAKAGTLKGVVLVAEPWGDGTETVPGVHLSAVAMPGMTPVKNVTSDENGAYIFEDIPAGRYIIRVFPGEKPYLYKQINDVAVGEGVTELNISLVPSAPELAVLKGHVSEMFMGGSEWIPLKTAAKIRVFDIDSFYNDSNPAPILETETDPGDPEGKFFLYGLPYGGELKKYVVTAMADGYEPWHMVFTCNYPEIIINIGMKKMGDPDQIGVLKGVVTEETEIQTFAPVYLKDVHIVVYNKHWPIDDPTSVPPVPVAETFTNEMGQYEFSELAFGEYVVLAEAEGFSPLLRAINHKSRETFLNFMLKRIEVPEGKGILKGHVREWNNDSTQEKKSIAGAEIILTPASGVKGTDGETDPPEVLIRAVTDENGFYKFKDLPFGVYEAGVKAEGYLPQYLRIAFDQEVMEKDFFLKPDGTQPPPDDTCHLSGLVSEDVGMLEVFIPIKGALIQVYTVPPDEEIKGSAELDSQYGWPVAYARTDEGGYYEIPELPYGKFLVLAKAQGYYLGREIIEVQVKEKKLNFRLEKITEPTPTPIDVGTIKGRVVEESIYSSIAPKPIGGALIKVYLNNSSDGGEESGSPAGEIIFQAITGNNGEYIIQGIPFGDYLVTCQANGYQFAKKLAYLNGPEIDVSFSLKPLNVPTPTPTPIPGDEGVIFGYVKEDPGLLTVMPPPIPGALIRAYRTWWHSNGDLRSYGQPVAEARSGENGFYKLPALPLGQYLLSVEAKGYVEQRRLLHLSSERQEEIFLLKRAEGPVPTPTPHDSGAIFGTVFGGDDGSSFGLLVPIKGAIVEVFPPVDCNTGDERCIVPPIARAVTDENGKYKIGDIPPGPWEVKARAEGYKPGFQYIELKSGEEKQVDFVLEKGQAPPGNGVIYGKVVNRGVNQFSEDWYPLIKAKIEIFDPPVYASNGDMLPGPDKPVAVVFTNESGEYRVGNLEHRYYTVRASKGGWHPDYKHVQVGNEPVLANFALHKIPEPTPTPIGAVVRGRVYEKTPNNEKPKPIAGAAVVIMPGYYKNENEDNSASGGEELPLIEPVVVFTDENGLYIAEGLKGGHYRMTVKAEGYYPRFRHVRLHENRVKVVHFRLKPIEPEPTKTPVPENGIVFGKVFAMIPRSVDRPTTPIQGALVSLFQITATDQDRWPSLDPIKQTETDAEGRYKMGDIAPGSYMIAAEAPGFKREMRHFWMPPEGEIRMDIGLKPEIEPTPTPVPETGAVAGIVLGVEPTGAAIPVEGARVMLFIPESMSVESMPGPYMFATTDKEGKFLIDDVMPRGYALVVRAFGYEPATYRCLVQPSEVTEFTIHLYPDVDPTPIEEFGALEGNVAFADEAGDLIPIPSARVQAIRMENDSVATDMIGERPMNRVATDELGYYKINDLLPGRYMVMVWAEGFEEAQKKAAVAPQECAVVDFVLEKKDEPTTKTGAIFGRVMTLDEATTPGGKPFRKPVEAAEVLVFKLHTTLEDVEILIPAGRALTDAEGIYLVDKLAPGVYVVVARKAGYSWSMKKARVRMNTETKVNFIILPSGEDAHDPIPEEDVFVEGDFEDDENNWIYSGIPQVFDEPVPSFEQGRLRLRSRNNRNTYGCWESPRDAIPVEPDCIYKATFALSSDVEDLTQVPCVRIRFNNRNEQVADMVVMNSSLDGAASPGIDGRVYTHYFASPEAEIIPPETENTIYVAFDLVNLTRKDAETATVNLEWITIESIARGVVPEGEEILTIDFSDSTNGWYNQFGANFDQAEALSAPDLPGLGLRARSNTNTYAAWTSPLSVITLESDILYSITWDISSDQTELERCPAVRFRAGDDNNRLITQKCIFSRAEGDNSPDPVGKDYTLYYLPSAPLTGSGMVLSWDMVNMHRTNAEDGVLGLRAVTIKAIDINELP